MKINYLLILFLSNIIYSSGGYDDYVSACSKKICADGLNIDSIENNNVIDSLKTNNENEILERKWGFLGFFNATDKNGKVNEHSDPVYYDVNHLVYEGDSVLVMLKKGYTNKWYHYISLNLITKIIYRIDTSTPYYGKSITIIWEDEWWKADDEFLNALYEAVKK